MWFNSMIREEPYPGLNCNRIYWKQYSRKAVVKVLHGCRQLVQSDLIIPTAALAVGIFCLNSESFAELKESNAKVSMSPTMRKTSFRERSKFKWFGREDKRCPFVMPLPKDYNFVP